MNALNSGYMADKKLKLLPPILLSKKALITS
jgi:hypothetical protein